MVQVMGFVLFARHSRVTAANVLLLKSIIFYSVTKHFPEKEVKFASLFWTIYVPLWDIGSLCVTRDVPLYCR